MNQITDTHSAETQLTEQVPAKRFVTETNAPEHSPLATVVTALQWHEAKDAEDQRRALDAPLLAKQLFD